MSPLVARSLPGRTRFVTAAFLLLPATRALAAQSSSTDGWPGLTASFIAPTGTALPTENIDVWVRLTLAPTAQAITFDRAAGAPDFGLPAGFLPTTGRAIGTSVPQPFAGYTSVATTAAFGCESTFGGPAAPDGQPVPCRAAAYRFVFNTAGTPDRPSFSQRSALTLLPGQSFDFVLGAFQVQNGAAPLGTYTFRRAIAAIDITGYDAQNRLTFAQAVLATTCTALTAPDCQTFRRDVVAAAVVPEPGTVMLFGAGLLVLGGATARRGPVRFRGPARGGE